MNMKKLYLIALLALVSACGGGGGGTEPIPEKFDLSNILWKWKVLEAPCDTMTAIGSGLTSGGPDTVYFIKKTALELTVDYTAIFDYNAYSDPACTVSTAQYQQLYQINEWVIPTSNIGVPAQLIYMGSSGNVPPFSPPFLLKVLFTPANGQLKMFEDTDLDTSQLDADGYPMGTSPPSATFVRP